MCWAVFDGGILELQNVQFSRRNSLIKISHTTSTKLSDPLVINPLLMNEPSSLYILIFSPHKAEKLASPTVTNSCKAEIPACRSLIYSCKDEISAWKFRENTVTNNVVSGSSGTGDPTLWQLRGDSVKH